MLKQKNIVIDLDTWDKLKILSNTINTSISEIIRTAIQKYLKEETKNNLAYQMQTLTPILTDKEEEQEIMNDLKLLNKKGIKYGKKIKL